MRLAHEGRNWEAIAFSQGHWAADMPQRIDVAYHFERNEWKGKIALQLNVQNMRPAEEL